MRNRIETISILIALVLVVCELSLTLVLARAEDGEVHIPDVNLRAVILEMINAKSAAPDTIITQAEMSNLIRLEASNAKISDLTGLEYATRLTELYLNINSISDITPLSKLNKLNNLTRLDLSDNSISDITSLSKLTGLKGLRLYNNKISDLSPLVANPGLVNGDGVDVGNNPLSATSLDTHIPALKNRGVTVEIYSKVLED